MTIKISIRKTILLGGASIAMINLGACSTVDQLANVGKPPAQSTIANPVADPEYNVVSMPMPAPQPEVKKENSLWSASRQTFFEDQRANEVGDILTVLIDINDEAELENESERTRNANESAGLNSFLGYELDLGQLLPEAVDNTDLVDAGTTSSHSGEGSIEREEEINLQMAATVTQVLPNGNLVIHGKQEVRVNFENRILQIAGVIRPEDITPQNTIGHQQIAEARISYGGEGQITNVQQPRIGQQVYDILMPF